jgi:glycosyltransferase involved in cell wall biosynthesis
MNSTEKKKLLILYTKNPDEVFNRKSAIGSYVHCLAGLLSQEFEVTLNYHDGDFVQKTNHSETSVPVHSAGLIKKLIPKKLKSFLRDKKHFTSLADLKQKIKSLDIRFDVILEFYNFGSDVGLQLSEYYKCPLNIIYDGPIFEEYEFFNGHKTWFEKKCREYERKTFEKAANIVVYSQPMIEFCVEHIHARKEKYKIHQNIDFSRFHFFEGEKDFSGPLNLCFIGSFLKWHRVDLLLKAISQIPSRLPNLKITLFLIGEGQEFSKMKKLALDLNLQNIEFTGFLDSEALTNLIKKMHVGIMSGSNWYGAPNKLFEYGAMKLACLAPETRTIKYLFHSNEICFFENNNFESLQTSLFNLLKSSEMMSNYSRNAHKKITQKYSPEITKQFYINLMNA